MDTTEPELAATYRNLPEPEIAALYAEIETLTEPARLALSAEIQRRGLNDANLKKLHAAELRREARFDRLENRRRKNLAWYLLTRNDPKGLLFAILAGLALAMATALFARHH